MSDSIQSTVTLNNGYPIPRLGLGVYKAQEGEEVMHAVKWALQAGYRLIDTAALYGNETGVGDAVRQSGIVVQMGTQVRSWPTSTGCRELFRSGAIGKVSRIEQCRNGSKPYWYSWMQRAEELGLLKSS